jgi:iron complex outermembrane receptor protein
LRGCALAARLVSQPGRAQRVTEDVVAQARDAFGVSIGNERVGLCSASNVRGFSPVIAGDIHLADTYFDRTGSITDRPRSGTRSTSASAGDRRA